MANATKDDERRRYFRIEDTVCLEYRVLSQGELDDCLQRFYSGAATRFSQMSQLANMSFMLKPQLRRIEKRFPDVADCLQIIDEKIDTVVKLFVEESAIFPSHSTRIVSLSAVGISFGVEEALEQDAMVEIKLILFPSYTSVMAYGKVVHVDAAVEFQDKYTVHPAIDFVHIRESDRELLISHVVSKQYRGLVEKRANQ